jgi:hypothetical protein
VKNNATFRQFHYPSRFECDLGFDFGLALTMPHIPIFLQTTTDVREMACGMRLNNLLYGQSLQMWPKGPMGASPAVVSLRGNRKRIIAIVQLL